MLRHFQQITDPDGPEDGQDGQEKEGHIIVLVTEGKEQQILKDCLIHKDNIAFHVLSSKELAKGLNSSSPRLIPPDIRPRCEKIHITVKKPALTRNSSIKDMFRNASSSSSEPTFSPDLELIEVPERIPKVEMLWNKKDPLDRNNSTSNIFSKNVEKLRSLQPINQVKHSKSSELLQLVDSKRYNIPSTQIGTSSQLTQNRKMKQGDIRTMFLKASEHEVPQSTKGDYCSGSKELFTEISNYLSIQMSLEDKKCSLCPDDFDCSKYNINIPNIEMSWIQLDDTSLDPKPEEIFDLALEDFVDKSLLTLTHRNKEDKIFKKLDLTQLEKMAENIKGNADITLEQMEDAIIEKTNDDLSFVEKSCVFEAPKNLGLLFSRYGASIIDETEITETKFPEQTITKRINEEELLGFFHLTSIADLFTNETKIGSSQETIIYSPDMFTDTFAGNKSEKPDFNEGQRSDDDFQLSPVLCKYNRSKTIKKKSYRVAKTPDKPNLQKLKLLRMRSNDEIDTPSKFTMNATKISSTPCVRKITNGNNDCGVNLKNISVDSVSKAKNETFKSILENSPKKSEINKVDIDIEDICDLSIFGISPIKDKRKKSPAIDFDIDDFCDLASFGITTQKKVDDNEIRKETKLNAVDDKDKSSSQSQWPITQILSYINKSDTQSVSLNSPENTTKPLKDVINKEAVSSQQIGSTKKKSRLCLNTTLEPFKSPPPKSQAKKSLNTLFNTIASDSTNSDDEFEEKSLNPVFKKPRLTQPRINVHNRNSHNSKASSVNRKNPFVADEAELSEDENVQVSDDEDDGDQSIYESSFVTDETQHVDTQMHARYLQSIKSPCNRGKFKIPTKPRFNVGNVYSQEVNHADDTYLDDSFVVFDEVEPSQHELSELEILEKKIERAEEEKEKAV
ncbi:hypothetical protein NQ317_016194 [Molorchus minor]|uniref:Uncharacterized protein n=1 Tax=Molorchus minor TaxID=1323400 RepID=A0ABQ9J050_9CUCU|nr:hypothetical protein NQ317_016194 [Molorchus minor]